MPSGKFTPAVTPNIIPEIWEKKIYNAYYGAFRMKGLLDTMPVPLGTDTQNLTTLGQLTAEAVVAGVDMSPKYIVPGNLQLSMDQYFGVPFSITEKFELQCMYPDFASRLQVKAGQALAYNQEAILLTLYSSMSQEIPGITTIDADCINYVKQLITEANCPEGEVITGVITPYQFRKMIQGTNISSAANFGNPGPIQKGILEELYGIKILVSNYIPTVSAHKYNLFFASSYAVVGTQQDVNFKIDREFDPHTLAKKASAVHLWGYKEIYDGHAVRVPTSL